MAVTLPDVTSSATSFINVYTATGLPVGTKLIIQNKSSNTMYIQVKATQPSATSVDGNIITSYEFIIIDGGDLPGVWVRGAGKISVQVFD